MSLKKLTSKPLAIRKAGARGAVVLLPPEWLSMNGLSYGNKVYVSIDKNRNMIVRSSPKDNYRWYNIRINMKRLMVTIPKAWLVLRDLKPKDLVEGYIDDDNNLILKPVTK